MQIARSLGQSADRGLFDEWGGKPTSRWLLGSKCTLRRYVNLEAQALAGHGRDPISHHITPCVQSVDDGWIVSSSEMRSN